MKKHKKTNNLQTLPNNPVAKFAHLFNKVKVYKDKTKYSRHGKHKGAEPFPMGLVVDFIGKGFTRAISSPNLSPLKGKSVF
jgi:hypothetical protein